MSEQVQHLGLFAAVVGGLWTFGLSLDALIIPITVSGGRVDSRAIVLELAGISVALAIYVFTTRGSQTTQRTLDVGLVSMILNSGGVALLNTWVTRPQTLQNADIRPSWISVIILIFFDDLAGVATSDAGGQPHGGRDDSRDKRVDGQRNARYQTVARRGAKHSPPGRACTAGCACAPRSALMKRRRCARRRGPRWRRS